MSSRHSDHDRLIALGSQLAIVHGWLRDELAELRDDLAAHHAGHGDRPRPLAAHCLAFCDTVSRHHTDEDRTVFPALARRHPALRPVIDKLVTDHGMVAHLIGRIRRLVEESAAGPSNPSGIEAARAEFDALGAVLETHFRYEEKQITEALNALDDPSVPADAIVGVLDEVPD